MEIPLWEWSNALKLIMRRPLRSHDTMGLIGRRIIILRLYSIPRGNPLQFLFVQNEIMPEIDFADVLVGGKGLG